MNLLFFQFTVMRLQELLKPSAWFDMDFDTCVLTGHPGKTINRYLRVKILITNVFRVIICTQTIKISLLAVPPESLNKK